MYIVSRVFPLVRVHSKFPPRSATFLFFPFLFLFLLSRVPFFSTAYYLHRSISSWNSFFFFQPYIPRFVSSTPFFCLNAFPLSSLAHDPPPPCPNLLVLYILVSRPLYVQPFSSRVFFVGSNPTSPPSNRVCTSSLMHADPMSARETANAACMRVLATCALHFLPRTLLWDARAVLFSFPL